MKLYKKSFTMRITSSICFLLCYIWTQNMVNGSNRFTRQTTDCRGMHQCASGQCIELTDVCNGLNQCHDGSDELPSACDCGGRMEEENALTNVTGVRSARPGSHPWHAGIYRKRIGNREILMCSGVLVYNDIILTAASCVIDPETQLAYLPEGLVVSLGQLSRDLYGDEEPQQKFKVTEVVIRDFYEGFYKNFMNNLAIIKLKTNAKSSDFVTPVCLWQEKKLPPGVNSVSIAGWGLQFSGPYAINLREANAELSSVMQCTKDFSENLYRKYITGDKFCIVLKDGVGIRAEDAGGPITIYQNGRHYLYGVISKQFGKEFGLGTLTRKHLDWIKNTTFVLKQNHQGGKKCVIPVGLEIYTVTKCSLPGQCADTILAPSNSKYQVTCPDGYGIIGKAMQEVSVLCVDGKWTSSNNNTSCIKMCKMAYYKSLELSCSYLGQRLPCNALIPPRTQIDVKCKRQYRKRSSVKYIEKTYCTEDGSLLDYLHSCEPECGKPFDQSKSQTLIDDGQVVEYNKYPWHIALYWEDENRTSHFNYKCGGSLLDSNKVLTAAHCVWVDKDGGRAVDAKLLHVASGKLYSTWPDQPEEVYLQKTRVKRVILGPHFEGGKFRYANDIAVLILEKDLILSATTLPACLDLDMTSSVVSKTNQLGHVIGWGTNRKFRNISRDILQETHLIYLDIDSCRKKYGKTSFADFLQPDKYCAIRVEGSVQGGDSGGGMTFALEGLHYLFGIASLKQQDQDEFVVFTDILYKSLADWLAKVIEY